MQNIAHSHLPLRRPGRSRVRMTRWGLPIALVAAADWLLFDRPIGVSLSLFIGLLALAAMAGNRLRATGREAAFAAMMLGLGIVPTIETSGFLSGLFGLAGLAVFVLGLTGGLRVTWPVAAARAVNLLTADTRRRLHNAAARRRGKRPTSNARRIFAVFRAWIVPVGVGMVFAGLFSIANPAFLSWISLLDPTWILTDLQPIRYAFWSFVAFILVPVTRVPAAYRLPRAVAGISRPASSSRLGEGLVLRSLIVVNMVFALQTGLDLVHLWGGAALPLDVTPAENAQRAAYILVLSALLAAGLVLLAGSRAAGANASGSLISTRVLLHAWIAQNVVLVLSAMQRLSIYVESYALTELRITAFVWMALVAVGLVLVEWRLAFAKSGTWLAGTNLLALGFALYACVILDLKAFAADYNVEHSRELTGTGAPLDREYLCMLGGSALPAIDAFLGRRWTASAPGSEGWMASGPRSERYLTACARQIRLELAHQSLDWRAWTFRQHRLQRYIDLANDSSRRPDNAVDDPGRR